MKSLRAFFITCNSRREADAESTLRAVAVARDVSAGTGIAQAGLPRLARSLEYYDFLREQVEELQRKPEIKPPLLTGKDLIKLGMKPGPAMARC